MGGRTQGAQTRGPRPTRTLGQDALVAKVIWQMSWCKGNGLEARPWQQLTPKQPGAVEESLLKAHYEPGGGLQQPRLRLSGSGTGTECKAPKPTAPSENAQSLSLGQPPFNRQLRPTKAPGVPIGHHGGGGHMRMRRSSRDQAGAPDNRTTASQPGGNTRRQGQTTVFDSDCT